jgi:hypothetical protein
VEAMARSDRKRWSATPGEVCPKLPPLAIVHGARKRPRLQRSSCPGGRPIASFVGRVVVIMLVCFATVLLGAAVASAAAPTITSIAPNNGPLGGGTSVAVTGTGFISGTTIKFGSTSSPSVTINSATSLTAVSPAGSSEGVVNVTATNSNGTSSAVPKDQFAYDGPPSGPWLGLDGNSNGAWVGGIGDFTSHNVVYDRGGAPGIDWPAGEVLEEGGKATSYGEALAKSIEASMIPDVTIEYSGYTGEFKSDPRFPSSEAQIAAYVEGFVRSAKAIHEKYASVIFEPMNEPWGYTTPQYNGAEYAKVIAALLPAAKTAGVPIKQIYVAGFGADKNSKEEWTSGWIPSMYEAEPQLETEIQGWYFHPYGPAKGSEFNNSYGIQSLPEVQKQMTSGQNNIIVSEVGYCARDVNEGKECNSPETETSTQAAALLTEMLDNAQPYHEAGWLKALIVYARSAGGWAMEIPTSKLTMQGEALDKFGNLDGSSWSLQSPQIPAGATKASFSAVTCRSVESCIAVGSYANSGGTELPLVESWNGKEWTLQEARSPSSATSTWLSAISCSSAESCTTVGGYSNKSGANNPLAERWTGKEWVLQEPHASESSEVSDGFSAVQCPAAESCIAIGEYVYADGPPRSKTYVERWNGASWSTPEVILVGGSTSLSQISCTASSACTAVGSQGEFVKTKLLEEFRYHAFADVWNGSSWSSTKLLENAGLGGVSCSSFTVCTAVGDSGAEPLAYSRNGAEWTLQAVPKPGGATETGSYGVSCTSTSECRLVGGYSSGSESEHGFAATRNGTSWLLQAPPLPSGAKASRLTGTSCASATVCVSVGDIEAASGKEEPLAEHFE